MTNPNVARGVNRRRFLETGALSAATLAGAGALASAPGIARAAAPAIASAGRPNLLFINVDQLSAEAVGAYGCKHVHTPNMDRLAARGVSFVNSYSADPVCCPARAAWMTGRMSSENGVVLNSWPLRKDLPDMGAWLREKAGYETFYCGKWHVPARACSDGFTILHGGTGQGEYSDESVARACEAFLMNRAPAAGAPFLLVAGFLQPHDICYWYMRHQNARADTPVPYAELANELPPLPPNFTFDPREPEAIRARRSTKKGRAVEWSPEFWRYAIWSYYRHVEMVDAAVGQILDALEDSGHAANTVVVFTADHGDGHGRHQLKTKSFLYDAAVRVPLIVSWPGHAAAGRLDSRRLASGVDLLPTLCDYAGVAAPPRQRGYSLRPVVEDRAGSWREFVSAQSSIEGRMLRTADFKYIAYKGDATEQLFDMKNDPWETKNLAAEAKHASTLEDHRKALADWESKLESAALPSRGQMANPKKAKNKAQVRAGVAGQDIADPDVE